MKLTNSQINHTLNDDHTPFGFGLMLLIFIFILISLGVDPLHTLPVSKLYVENYEGHKQGFNSIYKDFKEQTHVALTDGELAQLVSDVNLDFESQNLVIHGEGRVVKIEKLNYNYSIEIEYLNLLGKIDKVYIRVILGEQDERITSMKQGDYIKFKGKYHLLSDIGSDDMGGILRVLFLKYCEVLD